MLYEKMFANLYLTPGTTLNFNRDFLVLLPKMKMSLPSVKNYMHLQVLLLSCTWVKDSLLEIGARDYAPKV